MCDVTAVKREASGVKCKAEVQQFRIMKIRIDIPKFHCSSTKGLKETGHTIVWFRHTVIPGLCLLFLTQQTQ